MYGILKKFGNVLLFFFLLSFFSFMLLKLAPGDPVLNILGTQELTATEQDVEQMRQQLGFNKPLLIQYYDWLSKVIHLDFGKSIITGKSVISQIEKAFPCTLILSLSCIIVMLIIAVPLGILSAFYRGGIADKISELFNIVGSSIPGFWLGFILVDVFAIKLNLLPSMGIGGIRHIILPALTLGISLAPPYVRLLKTSLIESMNQDFVTAAQARGVPTRRIFCFHVLRKSLIPVITLFGMSMGSLMGGTVVIEVLFSYPGLGKLAIEAITNRDYPMIQGFILFIGMVVFLINLTIDMLYRIIDPSTAIKEAEQVEV